MHEGDQPIAESFYLHQDTPPYLNLHITCMIYIQTNYIHYMPVDIGIAMHV